ncbi:hypothetical protein [Enterococcus casseliflavus]|uniref:hypothetical protein n=1 Tax=Enterococcus casseliflavus TaxID=37734 RepID=UPI0018ABBABE|nr:hypothetical protein [Enterococcus casseliflavus]
MRTINDNYKRLKDSKNELKALRDTFTRQEKKLLQEIELQEKYIVEFSKNDEKTAVGMQLVNIEKYDEYEREFKDLVNFAIDNIKSGYMPELLSKKEVFGYWYNSDFQSGYSRVIERFMGERYAQERAQISFAEEMYEDGYELTTQDTLAILSYLTHLLSDSKEG